MKTSVLLLCLGNICILPLAEGILKKKLLKDRYRVDSAGTTGYHIGHLPDQRGIDVAVNNGIDIRHQKARKFYPDDFDLFDKIFVMDLSNLAKVRKMALSAIFCRGGGRRDDCPCVCPCECLHPGSPKKWP